MSNQSTNAERKGNSQKESTRKMSPEVAKAKMEEIRKLENEVNDVRSVIRDQKKDIISDTLKTKFHEMEDSLEKLKAKASKLEDTGGEAYRDLTVAFENAWTKFKKAWKDETGEDTTRH